MKKEIIRANDSAVVKNQFIQQPGDKVTQEMKPGGDIVSKIETKAVKATHRQYMKKDGTPGKQVIINMQPDK